MRRIICPSQAALLVLTLALPASAGIIDKLLPLLNGVKTKHVFTVPGVTSAFGGLETAFLCSSTDSKPMDVGIEIFDYDSTPLNDVTTGNGVQNIAAGETRVIVTAAIAAIADDEVMTLSSAANHGAARIISTSTKLLCTAMTLDATNSPPTSMVNLHVISKLKQKGN